MALDVLTRNFAENYTNKKVSETLVGPQGPAGPQGIQGEPGGLIKKIYSTTSLMIADTEPVLDGYYVACEDVQKTFLRNSEFTVLPENTTDFDGYKCFGNIADGLTIQGPQGPAGPQGIKGETGAAGPSGKNLVVNNAYETVELMNTAISYGTLVNGDWCITAGNLYHIENGVAVLGGNAVKTSSKSVVYNGLANEIGNYPLSKKLSTDNADIVIIEARMGSSTTRNLASYSFDIDTILQLGGNNEIMFVGLQTQGIGMHFNSDLNSFYVNYILNKQNVYVAISKITFVKL